MGQVRQVLRYHHYAYRTEQSYCDWILPYIKFHGGNTHPSKMGKKEIDAFLSHLATHLHVAAATQRQALNASVFLYRRVLDQPIEEQLEPVRSKRRPSPLLMAKMLYGCGLRLMECVRLRVQDIDLERSLIYVRAAKGGKDRTTVLAKSLQGDLRLHIERVRRLHEEDLSKGFGEVFLPTALSRKYPRAGREFRWQYVFPSKSLSVDPRSIAGGANFQIS